MQTSNHFYYSDIGPLGWCVVRRDNGDINRNVKETVVMASLRNDQIAARLAFEFNAGVRSENERVRVINLPGNPELRTVWA